jgi:hypothetical protein
VFQKFSLIAFVFASLGIAAGQEASLPPGPMQAKIKAACTQCHTAARITSQHRTRDEWDKQLDKMVGLGAVVSDVDRKGFLNYLTKNFGPGNKLRTVQKTETSH